MSVVRRLALGLLHIVVRRSSSDSQRWGKAMLGELDSVESDWAALLWALGSTTALLRHSVPRQLRTALEKRFGAMRRPALMDLRKKIVGMLSGLVIAGGVLTICVFAFLSLMPRVFPHWQLVDEPLVLWLPTILIPETVFIVTAIVLWRKKRPMATGLLLAAMTFIAHVVIHATTH